VSRSSDCIPIRICLDFFGIGGSYCRQSLGITIVIRIDEARFRSHSLSTRHEWAQSFQAKCGNLWRTAPLLAELANGGAAWLAGGEDSIQATPIAISGLNELARI
jgi:hypothetical protein